MNRGSPSALAVPLRGGSGFNEAPIHESGKCERGSAQEIEPLASMRPRFMNRGSPVVTRSLLEICQASMRPRFMNRGSAIAMTTGVVTLAGFNEAPIHESGKCCPGSGRRRWSSASMRPRFMNRGSRGAGAEEGAVLAASMRPRFMNRGSARETQS